MINTLTHRLIVHAAILLGLLAGMVTATQVQAMHPYSDRSKPPLSLSTDQIIVRFGLPAAAGLRRAGELSTAAGLKLRLVRTTSSGALVLKLPRFKSLQEVASIGSRLRTVAGVVMAEPDAIMLPQLEPNDHYYGNHWSYYQAQGINLPSAWDITTGNSNVVVAVIDTGILPHQDLSGRYLPGYDFIDDAAVANDGDGRDTDPTDPGDWVTANESQDPTSPFYGCGSRNSSWHGIHVAGTIGAAGNNGIGVTGVTWNSMILPVRVLGKCGGYLSDVADGMRWAAGLTVPEAPPNPNPAKVLNLSLGGSGSCSSTFQQTIDEVVAAGTVVVVAAGNSNTDAVNFQPANCTGVITVAATDQNGNKASFSNYGAVVKIGAPGTGILSTLNTGTTVPVADSYAYYQGTSMATPHVAGVVGLMFSHNPRLTPTQVRALLQSSARPFPEGSTCRTSPCGAGIVNAAAALNWATPPRVTIVKPADGATFNDRDSIIFTGTATKNGAQTDLSADLDWTSNLDGDIGRGSVFTRTLSVGAHTTRAQVTDSDGLTGSTNITVTVKPSNTAPKVRIEAPADGANVVVGQTISFTGTASDDDDGNLTSSLSWSSNLTGPLGRGGSITVNQLSVGTHTITAQVSDSGGLSGSAAITLIVQVNKAPLVSISAPVDGTTFTADQSITFTGTATDDGDGDPTANLSWRSDRDGAIGSGDSFSHTLSVGIHTIQAQVTDSNGATGTATLTVNVINPTTIIFTSLGGSDGWVLESTETSDAGGSLKSWDTSNKGLLLGDSSKKQQYKSILSFNTSSLPDNATITSATLRLQRGTVSGVNPFDTHGALLADLVTGGFNGNTALETADFQATPTATEAASLSNAASDGAWSTGTLTASGLAAINKKGNTQFRLYFSLDDNNDSVADYLGYYGGEYGTADSRPRLVVNYVVNAVPVVKISAPTNEAQFMPGTPITFSGTASDTEDGDITSRLVWTSDLDDEIGKGGFFPTTSLSDGIHTITATVVDGFGAQATASITLINSANHRPTVTIDLPTIAGDVITCTGTATDAENGDLTDRLIWSSDRDGVIGSGGSFSRTLSVGTHTIQAQATDNGGFPGKATLTITVADSSIAVTLNSLGAEDGWVLESPQTSNVGGSFSASGAGSAGLRVGDESQNQQYKSILSFNTAALPDNVTITSATLRLRRGTVRGTSPFSTHGVLLADVVKGTFNSATLEKADFEAPATTLGVASLSNAASNGTWSEGVLDSNGLAAINKTGKTQFRLYFGLDDDDDNVADYVGYYAGEYGTVAFRPQLAVTYR